MVVTKSANKWSWSGDRGTGKKGNVSSRAFLINSDTPLPTLPLPRALPQCGHPCSQEIRIQPLTPGPEDNSRGGSNLLAPKLQRKPHWNRQQNTKPVINTQFSEDKHLAVCTLIVVRIPYTFRKQWPFQGILPGSRLMDMCRWLGSHFHDWSDYYGVAFL